VLVAGPEINIHMWIDTLLKVRDQLKNQPEADHIGEPVLTFIDPQVNRVNLSHSFIHSIIDSQKLKIASIVNQLFN
jgi:hypothetical protein